MSSSLIALDDISNPYPADSLVVDGEPYLAYKYPYPATNVVFDLHRYQLFLAREDSVSNIINKQSMRFVSFKNLGKAQRKKRILKGITIAGVIIDTTLKAFFLGYGYRILQGRNIFP